VKIPLEQAMIYALSIRSVPDSYAESCAYTLASELTAMRQRAALAQGGAT